MKSQSATSAASEPEFVTGSREQLLHLLAEAAEIEHTLMCSYLYAAFSLKRDNDDDFTPVQGEAVERWRKTIMGVAIEEMGHMLIVANLILAVGGRPHFTRPNFPIAPGYFPSGVVVRLSGFSAEALEHFIFLEKPQGAEGEDADAYAQDDYVREQALPGLMPSAQDYTTIAHLYDAIRANLTEIAGDVGEDGLFIGGTLGQLGAKDVDMPGVAPIATLNEAMSAIDVIVEQGEGSSSDRDDSHYRSFITIRQDYLALREDEPDFAPALPVANNPVLRRPPDPVDRQYVDGPAAASLLDFACATYGLLLRTLVASLGRSGRSAKADRSALMQVSFGLMHVLATAASALARMPASPDAPGVNAGMTFTMLRGTEPLMPGKVEHTVIIERLRELAQAAQRLELQSDVAEKLRLLASGFRIRA